MSYEAIKLGRLRGPEGEHGRRATGSIANASDEHDPISDKDEPNQANKNPKQKSHPTDQLISEVKRK